MTVGNHGAGSPPEDDDPFAHLYRPEGGAAPAGGGAGDGTTPIPGVPRTSYTQVRAVGERTYGGQQAAQQVPPQQPYPYGQASPSPHYAAPETYGGAPQGPPPFPPGGPDGGPRRGRGGGRNGLMLGAVAVVATVVIAIVAAVLFSGDGESSDVGDDGQTTAPSPEQPGGEDKNGDDKPEKDPTDPPSEDGAKLELAGGAVVGNDPEVSEDGSYVHGMYNPGASVTWNPEVADAGEYTLFVGYSVPGKDADLTLTVNGEAQTRPVNMGNFAGAKKDDWVAGWTRTFSWISLDEGANEIKLSCESGNKECQSAIGQVWLKEGHVETP